MAQRTDALVIGAGLAGLVAAVELAEAGRSVRILEQEGDNSVGGQAHWSLGGLFLVDTPEQRRMGIVDSAELAWQDWLGSAGFDRVEDHWPRRTAEAFVEFAAGGMRDWLHGLGMRWFPVVGWAERGGAMADGHGNSVPRFHITWGTGPGVLAPFLRRIKKHVKHGRVVINCRHRVDGLTTTQGRVAGATGAVLAPSNVERGQRSSRDEIDVFEYGAEVVVVASGGIGGDHDKVRAHWPVERLGAPPARMLSGVPHHVDGRMIDIAADDARAAIINADRMWHYTEGVANWSPIWPAHGIRIIPGPSSLWLDATGRRLPAPCLPGFDTLTTLREILATGHDYSWFVLDQSIIEKEFALSGSEQNPDMTSQSWRAVLRSRLSSGAPPPVEAFKAKGADFVVADDVAQLAAGMNRLTGERLIDARELEATITARDRQVVNGFAKDAQITAIHGARRYRGDRLFRVAKPHRLLDPVHGPLIAVRLHILTRKTLGGLHTDIDGRVLDGRGEAIPGLYGVGEAAGFGGGGYHGYNALEGTFLGGCLFSGRRAGRHAAGQL
ncbi:FAD-binding dehydrogenase [Salinisphaera hydrothermalis]|uniref:FAD-binding dehydrogenase n=1 Tax=Salinisphaera hydrothermalis (strain C41B8) TaxID=1304275 RepID=A0A084IMH2_SALHC|nr:FAD-binding dehydrogenase [Salinisphaera hydrothermalis]KEZ77906.1 FAD-binding dehydrogenase [Salinisphaera hydrothermalis C41B8]